MPASPASSTGSSMRSTQTWPRCLASPGSLLHDHSRPPRPPLPDAELRGAGLRLRLVDVHRLCTRSDARSERTTRSIRCWPPSRCSLPGPVEPGGLVEADLQLAGSPGPVRRVLAVPALVHVVNVVINHGLGAPLPSPAQLSQWPDVPVAFLDMLVLVGLGEEGGWTAFAAPVLLRRHGLLGAWAILSPPADLLAPADDDQR